ncbi:MAG TPA: PP2C family serine/threonine-protein phosphatase, partial [Armatimonadota bacterium]|nr:PP2C family serine/threonine-protein phosphatase [Armatimonadota bacterium]
MNPASAGDFNTIETELLPLASYLEEHADDILQRAERAWSSSILLFSQLTETQHEQINDLSRRSIYIWATRLRQSPDYARQVYELGRDWGEQASQWQLHIYSFTKALDLLTHAAWDFLAETYPPADLSPSAVFFLGRSRDQIIDDLRVPLFSTFMQQREIEMEETRFTLQGVLSLPGRSLLQELANRLQANIDRVIPAWIESVHTAPGATEKMQELLERRGRKLVSLLLSLLQSPTPETGAESLSNVRAIGLESAQAGISFQDMFHALQQVRPILWDTVYDIYRKEQYWHPAEFIEVLARLHLLLDLFSEGIGQAYLQQKEMIIQEQAEEIRRRDLDLARGILEGLLPNRRLTLPYTDIGSIWIPAREIGGDFYDIFPLGNGDVMFIIGDVSGKGISAALLVSMVKYVLKANAPLHSSPASLLTVANNLFYQDMGPEMFVTMFAARYTPQTGKLVYTSAGHDPCYVCHASGEPHITTLSSQGPLLGVFEEIELTDCEVTLHPNDVLLLYTDGLVNVRCEDRRPVNPRRLCG